MQHHSARRLSMSFSPEQVIWLNELLVLARRSNDASVLMGRVEAIRVSRTIFTAAQKADGAPPKRRLGKPRPPPSERPNRWQTPCCRNGHPYCEENTGYDKRNGLVYRVCLECKKLKKQRYADDRAAALEAQRKRAMVKYLASREAEAAE